MSDGMSGGFRF